MLCLAGNGVEPASWLFYYASVALFPMGLAGDLIAARLKAHVALGRPFLSGRRSSPVGISQCALLLACRGRLRGSACE